MGSLRVSAIITPAGITIIQRCIISFLRRCQPRCRETKPGLGSILPACWSRTILKCYYTGQRMAVWTFYSVDVKHRPGKSNWHLEDTWFDGPDIALMESIFFFNSVRTGNETLENGSQMGEIKHHWPLMNTMTGFHMLAPMEKWIAFISFPKEHWPSRPFRFTTFGLLRIMPFEGGTPRNLSLHLIGGQRLDKCSELVTDSKSISFCHYF